MSRGRAREDFHPSFIEAVDRGALSSFALESGSVPRPGPMPLTTWRGNNAVGHEIFDIQTLADSSGGDGGEDAMTHCSTPTHISYLEAIVHGPQPFQPNSHGSLKSEVVDVVPGTVPQRPGLAVTGDRAVDQPLSHSQSFSKESPSPVHGPVRTARHLVSPFSL